MMKHFGYSARECIGWMRICRPGSVIGPQQQFLVDAEERLWREGAVFRKQRSNWPEKPLPDHKPSTDLGQLYLPAGVGGAGRAAPGGRGRAKTPGRVQRIASG